MSRRHELEQHLQVLGEIRDIMSAMKNLSFMEVRKLTRFLSTQRRVVASMESAASDFLDFIPIFWRGRKRPATSIFSWAASADFAAISTKPCCSP